MLVASELASERGALRVLVVDDHPVVREGLRSMIGNEPGIEVIGEASSGEEAVEKAAQLDIDVLLTDIRMPGMSGIELARRVKEMRPDIAVIMLAMYDNDQKYVLEALRAGAAGYLGKDAPRELLCRALRAVADGGTMVSSSLLLDTVRGLVQAPGRPEERRSGSLAIDRFTVRVPKHFYYSYKLTYSPFLLPLPAPQVCFPSGNTFTDSGQAVRYRCRGRSSSERT